MAEKKINKKQIGVKFEIAMAEQLEKEAKARGLDTASYIRTLVFTHPDRKKK